MPLNPLGLAEAAALILALVIPTTLFILGYYYFARSIDPFRKKERQDIDLGANPSVQDVERTITKLYRKGDKFAAFELYKQAHNVSFGDAETAVEQLVQSRK